MDFDYLYIFDMKKIKGKSTVVDEMFPYEEKIDLTDWTEIKLLDSNLMGFVLINSNKQLHFFFENVIECLHMFRYACKAQ